MKGGKLFISAYLTKELPLLERYGEGTWCLVSDVSSRLGLGIASGFAKRGFNLVLIGKNQRETEERMRQIVAVHRDTRFISIERDMMKDGGEELYEEIARQTTGIDVSVVVNSIKIDTAHQFKDMRDSDIRELLRVNCETQALMLNRFLDRLNNRTKRSAVVVFSSIETVCPSATLSLFAASQIFSMYLTLGLSRSNMYNNIDFLCLRCPLLSPSHTLQSGDRSNNDIEDIVGSVFRSLGNVESTYGSKGNIIDGMIKEIKCFFFPRIFNR